MNWMFWGAMVVLFQMWLYFIGVTFLLPGLFGVAMIITGAYLWWTQERGRPSEIIGYHDQVDNIRIYKEKYRHLER